MYIPVFCLSKHDTAFGNFFSATYSNDFSDSDQAKQLNWTKQNKNTSQGVKTFTGHVLEEEVQYSKQQNGSVVSLNGRYPSQP